MTLEFLRSDIIFILVNMPFSFEFGCGCAKKSSGKIFLEGRLY